MINTEEEQNQIANFIDIFYTITIVVLVSITASLIPSNLIKSNDFMEIKKINS